MVFQTQWKFLRMLVSDHVRTNFSVNAGRKTISHRGATLWANVEHQCKDKSNKAFSKQYRSFLSLQYE